MAAPFDRRMDAKLWADRAAVLGARVAVVTGVRGAGAEVGIGGVLTEVRVEIAYVEGRRVTVITVRIGRAAVRIAGDRCIAGV